MPRWAVISLGGLVLLGLIVLRVTRDDEVRSMVPDDASLRMTVSGPVRGFAEKHDTHAWLGLPFAKPPVGALRWQAPQPPTHWTETRDALAIGSLCPQFPSLLSGAGEQPEDDTIVGDEDCLYLNVFAPAFAPGEVPKAARRLPVMMWIHGGGNSIGHGGSYNGAQLAGRHDVVVVTINYRLGPLGWFQHPAVHDGASDPRNRSGNWGTLDTVRALEWIRANIGAFGGDPGRVTIFGESAGGANVMALLASPLGKGLFHRAIVQSGGYRTRAMPEVTSYADATPPGDAWSSREIVNRLLEQDGLAKDPNQARRMQNEMTAKALQSYLYGKDAPEILGVFDGGGFGMIPSPELFADGHVLPKGPMKQVFRDASRYNAVPVILGTNRDEPKLFMLRDPEWTKNWLGFLPRLRDEDAYQRAVYYGANAWKLRGVDDPARVLRKSQGPTVYAYRFDWDEERSLMGFDLSVALGAAHGLEIPFVFGDFEGGLGINYIYDRGRLVSRDTLARSMMSYWAEFAHSGTPGKGRGASEEAWLPWGTSGQTMMIFDTKRDGGIRMSSEEVTAERLRVELLGDDSFETDLVRCKTYARTFFFGPYWNEAEYESLGCGEWDPASFGR